jgi:mannose-6-phosphate isomerase-like protein (cupin superfamily)
LTGFSFRGLEMSLTVFQPGKGYPFLHRHRENDETYAVLGGRGQFWIDGETIEVSEGRLVRMRPAAVRTFRNNGDESVHLLVVKTRADGVLGGGSTDRERVEGKACWAS